MIPTRQTIFVATSANGRGNCMAACLASILEVPLKQVLDTASDAVRDDWYGNIQTWLGDRGFRLVVIEPTDPRLAGSYSIGVGPSPRGAFNHTVVCKSGVMVFDPHFSDDGVVQIDRQEILLLLTEAERALHARGALDPDPFPAG
ncbi:hypothetical protein [Beijerinckia sp. L45]|uniref:hypothetical protein n=1 Tax=Beijerinckia sp. L45 TaxID=1641855 RepID=UPI00131C596F|nr:hypothetical protein [Beijerinckia sp. L45]